MHTVNRRYVLLAAAFALVTAGVAAGLVLAFSGSSMAAPSKTEYFARVAAICRVYGPRLDRIAPPDISIPPELVAAVSRVLPILEGQTRAVRALTAPKELRVRLTQWFELSDRAITKLEEALRAGRKPDLGVMSAAYLQFLREGAAAKRLGREIGFPRPPC